MIGRRSMSRASRPTIKPQPGHIQAFHPGPPARVLEANEQRRRDSYHSNLPAERPSITLPTDTYILKGGRRVKATSIPHQTPNHIISADTPKKSPSTRPTLAHRL